MRDACLWKDQETVAHFLDLNQILPDTDTRSPVRRILDLLLVESPNDLLVRVRVLSKAISALGPHKQPSEEPKQEGWCHALRDFLGSAKGFLFRVDVFGGDSHFWLTPSISGGSQPPR